MGLHTTIRLTTAVSLFISGAIVLGICAKIETQVRTLSISTALYTFGAFVGGFTVAVETVLAVVRYWLPNSKASYLLSEILSNVLLWIFWLAAAIAITHDNIDARSICRDLDQITLTPDLQILGPEFIELFRRIMKAACRETAIIIAFLWIGVIITTFLMLFYLVIGTKKHQRIGRGAWYQSLARYDRSTSDPFGDPAGNQQAFDVGVISEDPDSK